MIITRGPNGRNNDDDQSPHTDASHPRWLCNRRLQHSPGLCRTAEAGQEGQVQGRLRADRKQQSLAPRPDQEHEGRSRKARLAAGLHRCRRFRRQAGRRRALDDRPEGGRHPAGAARGEAAHSGRHGSQEGRHPAAAHRPQRRSVAGQGRRGLCRLHRLGLRQGRHAGRRSADRGGWRQGQDHRAAGHGRQLARQ